MFRLDKSIDIPFQIQILEQINNHLHFGSLCPEDRLPSVRQLASSLGVNPKTVQSIYHYLESQGVVKIHPKSGVYISRIGWPATQERLSKLGSRFRDLVNEAQDLGLSERELKPLARRWLQPRRNKVSCALVECSWELLELVGPEISETIGIHIIPALLQELDTAGLSKIKDTELLLTTSNHLRDIQRLGISLHKEVFCLRLQRDFITGLKSELEKGKVLLLVKKTRRPQVLASTLKALLSPQENVDLTVASSDRKESIQEILSETNSIYFSSSCLPEVRDWILTSKPTSTSLVEAPHLVAKSSLEQLRDILTFF